MAPNDLVAKKLSEIIKQYGIELIDNPTRCTGLLKDFCGEHKREINLLVSALKERVPHELLSANSAMPKEVVVARLAKGLHDEHGYAEEFARWAVISWVGALGSRLAFAAPVPKPFTAPPPPPPQQQQPPPTAAPKPALSQSLSQTATPLDAGLTQMLYKVAGTWADPAVWPDLWKQIAGQAEKHGLDERMVRRRVKVLWDELEPVLLEQKRQEELKRQEEARRKEQKRLEDEKIVLEQKRLEEQERVEQKRQEELKRQEEARRKEQKRLEDEKIRLSTEARNERHLELLKSWLKTRPNGKWDYLQWDDFVDTLEPPVDLDRLEKIRDDIYFDYETGLMWERNGNFSKKEMTWHEAMDWVIKLNYAGYSDWRLPTIDELKSLAKRGGKRPADWLNANGFNNVKSSGYWSSTAITGGTSLAWVVNFNFGSVYSSIKCNTKYVRCVRGGQ